MLESVQHQQVHDEVKEGDHDGALQDHPRPPGTAEEEHDQADEYHGDDYEALQIDDHIEKLLYVLRSHIHPEQCGIFPVGEEDEQELGDEYQKE